MKFSLATCLRAAAVAIAVALVGCGGGGSDSVPSSGNSNVGAPASIIGKTVVQTVTRNDGSAAVIGVGKKITYSFIDANTIRGEGLHTLPTTSWSYGLSGNVATVKLQYAVGYANDTWTFTSPTGGTYRSETGLISGTKAWHEGTFTVTGYSGGSGGGTDGTGGTGGTGGSGSGSGSTTGQVIVWTSNSSSSQISVVIDGASAGTLTRYTTRAPNCGDSNGLTKTLSPGPHTIKATAGNRTWGPGSFTITAGGCLAYQLQ